MNDLGKVITITSGKGGVGKSTATVNIAHYFAFKGYKTLIIDLDIGLRTLDILLGINKIPEGFDIISVMEGKIDYKKTIIPVPKNKNLFFLAASEDFDKTALDVTKLNQTIEKMKDDYDYIIIDSPAGIENGFINSVFVADTIVLTVTPDNFSVNDADKVINLIYENNQIDKNIYFIVNKYNDTLAKNGDMYDIGKMKRKLSIPLLGIVQYDPKIIQSTDMGVPICLYKNTIGGEEFRNIVKRLLGEEIPLPKFSLFDKIKMFFKRG